MMRHLFLSVIILEIPVFIFFVLLSNQIKIERILLMLRIILNNDVFVSYLFNMEEQRKGKEKQRLPSGTSHFNNRTLSKESRLSIHD